MKYAVVKTFTDGTFTVEFFDSWKNAREYAEQMRALKSGIIESVIVYEASKY